MRSLTLIALAAIAAALPAQNEWHVSPTGDDANAGSSASPFRTIARAVTAAANGDLVRLAAGIYGDEQGAISLGAKELTIFGAGIGATILRSHTSIDQTLPTGPASPTPTTAPHRVTVTVQGTARVDLLDMTIDAAFRVPGHGRAACLFVRGGADVVCDRVEFANARANPLDASANAHGIVVRGDGVVTDTTTLTMRNCFVHDYGKSGVIATLDAALELEECRLDGLGHTGATALAQNGVRVTSGASARMRAVTLTDHWHDPLNAAASGVSLLDCGNVAIADCSFGNCENGVVAIRSTPGPMPVSMRRIHVMASELCVSVLNAQGVVSEGNSLHPTRGPNSYAALDNGSSNLWSGNFYGGIQSAAPLSIPGTAGAVDFLAQPFLRGFAQPEATPMPAGDAPVDVVAFDANGDGARDFLALASGASGPSVCLGLRWNGAFLVTRMPVGGNTARPIAIVDGEFDGQPGRDVAVLTASTPPSAPPTVVENKVTVFTNTAGVFTATQVVTLDGAINPSALVAGDLDGGLDDLVVTDSGAGFLTPGFATLLRNVGGTFTTSALPLTLLAAARDAAIADFDGDGSRDIAVGEGSPSLGNVHILRGNGNGAFSAWPTGPLAAASNLTSVCAGDLDGDSDADLVAACARNPFGVEPGSIELFDNAGAAGFHRTSYPVDLLPDSLAVGRLDGMPIGGPDSLDVAFVHLGANSIQVLNRNVPGCGFSRGGIARSGASAVSVLVCDMNADGIDDLVYADAGSNSVVVQQRGALAQSESYGAGTAGTAGRTPVIRPIGDTTLPTVPAPNFGVGVANGVPNSIAIIAISTSTTPTLIGVNDIFVTYFVITNAVGKADSFLPIPPDPFFIGLSIFSQAGVFDPAAQGLLPGLALTQGLRLRLGL